RTYHCGHGFCEGICRVGASGRPRTPEGGMMQSTTHSRRDAKTQSDETDFFSAALRLCVRFLSWPLLTAIFVFPARADAPDAAQASIRLSPTQRQMIGVTSEVVEHKTLKKTIRTVARGDFDERRLTDLTFKIGGWVQDLFVDYTGKTVRKGEPLL